ncbi:hypothetical protein [Pseudoalteromonas sp. MMG006]|uniref:hypothetical protein n=1 Tax=Pseudoalteromonas sp. MMG006 TaxID=2822683 RepID=UPI001FFD96F5|nr:hypothetical protein [Pseudoalteromonas sp. MMG006]
MKHSIKIAMASLLVLGSAHVNATEVDLDVTDILSTSVSNYVKQTTTELENSLKETLSFDAQVVLNSLLNTTQSSEISESATTQTAQNNQQ